MTRSDTDPPAARRRLRSATPAATGLLRLCAFLSPAHPIPVDALVVAAEILPPVLGDALRDDGEREQLFDAILAAAAGGVAGGELRVDPTVVRAIGEEMDDAARRSWVTAATMLLERACPADPVKPESHARVERLLPHVQAAAAHADAVGAGLAPAAQTLHLAGRYLLEVKGDAAASRELLTRAAALRERAHGQADVRVAWDLTYLNGALLHLGEWSEMARNAVRSADTLEAAGGPRDRIVITHVNNAALLLLRAGDNERAHDWFNRALRMAEPEFGDAHPFVATILSNLGDLHARGGDGDAAHDAYTRALQIDEGAYGPRHNSVARDLAKLGELLVAAGEGEEARPYLQRAADWYAEREGPADPRVLALRATLAKIDAPADS